MTADWEQYNFCRILEVAADARADEIKEAHRRLASSLNPDSKPEEEKRDTVLALIGVDAALETLSNEQLRLAFDARLAEMRKAASEKNKIETKRKGNLQEQQTIEEDEKLQKATLKYDSARDAFADFFYDRLFDTAKKSAFKTIAREKLMEWLSSERAESSRKAEEKGSTTSFRIDWSGFTSVQDMRKKRGSEALLVLDKLVEKLRLA